MSPISTLDRDKIAAFGHHGHTLDGVRKERRNGSAARAHKALKPMRFVSLHHHSTFSYLDGFQLPDAHARRAAELNMSAIAMTEHGNISSHVKLEKACRDEFDEHKQPNEAYGIKPLFGVELYMGRVGKDATQKKYHLTVVAKDQEGYRNLLKLVSMSYSEGFYHEPTVSWEMLKRYRQGLFVLSGCQGSLLFCSLVGGKLIEECDASYERALRVARKFKRVFGDHYFVEVQAFPELDKTRRANPQLARIAAAVGARLVATMDCHYTIPTEAEIQKILHNVRPGEKRSLEDLERDWGYDVPLCPPISDNHIYRRLRETGLNKRQALEAILSTEEIAQECNVELPKLPPLKYPVPEGFRNSTEYWRHLLREGWRFRGYNHLPPVERARAKAKLKKEMRIIEDKDFVEYILIVRDGIVFAKDYTKPPFEHGIPVGPARGSAAASIACYLLRVTEVNPILHPDLVFERFIDVSRSDPPDIDTDFASEGRWLVRDFYVRKYGEECVNNIGTFTYYKSKLALDDVARVHHIPKWEVETVKDLLLERSSGDLRASATIEDTVDQFDAARDVVDRHPQIKKAMDLEGNIKQFGVHAAGLVISSDDIREVCAVYERVVNKQLYQVVSMDKYDAERQGLNKLDFLGLKTMDMLAECLRQLDLPLSYLYDIPLDDSKTAKGFKDNDVVGIFQLEGRAARTVNGSLRAETFNEVRDVIALCRPGALHNGAANEYIDIKRGAKRPELIHPALEAITKDFKYQIVFQEQILRIVVEIGNFDWTHASYIRRIISKKHGDAEFNRQWERFWDGAKTLHKRTDHPRMTKDIAKKIWGMCITAGSYAFNIPHSISYATIGWWSQFFKQYYPPVFYAACLNKLPAGSTSGSNAKASTTSRVKLNRHTALMRDAYEHGVDILPPHPSKSEINWKRVGKRKIRAGFAQIEGFGESKANAIIRHRDGFVEQSNGVWVPEGESDQIRTWDDLIEVKGIGAKTLGKVKAWVDQEDPFGIHTLDKMINDAKEWVESTEHLPDPSHTAAEVPYDRGSDHEIVWIGLAMNRNLRDIFEQNRARTGVELKPEEVKEPGKNEFMLIAGYDGTEIVGLRIDRFKYPTFKKLLWEIKIGEDLLLVRGIKPGWRTAREINVKAIWRIRPHA